MKRVVVLLFAAVLVCALSACDTVANSSGVYDNPEIPVGADVLAYYGRTDNPLPSYADADSATPFAALAAADVVSVEALRPLVDSCSLTGEEQQTFVTALVGLKLGVREDVGTINDEGYPTYGASLDGGTLWFTVSFADGSQWLMHLKLRDSLLGPGGAVLYAGGREYEVSEASYNTFAKLFGTCEARMNEAALTETQPFVSFSREDIASADINFDGAWSGLSAGEIDELFSILQGISVSPATATNKQTVMYGSYGYDQLRIVCADGSSYIVGSQNGVYIDGFIYEGNANGLSQFVMSHQ